METGEYFRVIPAIAIETGGSGIRSWRALMGDIMKSNTYDKINSIEIGRINRNNIYNLIYKQGIVSKQSIANTLNVSEPTVAQNLKQLIKEGLAAEVGFFPSKGGRKSVAYAIEHNARYAIGLDITVNHLSVVIVNVKSEILARQKMRLRFKDDKKYFARVNSIMEGIITDAGIDRSKILGVGIALPAHISGNLKRVTYAPILQFTDGCTDAFAEFMNYPCVFINDASAACLAENWMEEDVENVVYLSLSNSVGGAILINNEIYNGENYRSAEFGHVVIHPDGKKCYCGKRGCADAYCNAKVLSNHTEGNLERFFKEAKTSEKNRKVLDSYLTNLCRISDMLRMSFDCKVILGGYVGSYLDEYLPEIRERLAQLNSFELDGSYLRTCHFKKEASAVGAALHYIAGFLEGI